MQSKAYISGRQIHLRSQNPQCSLLKQMHHNSFFYNMQWYHNEVFRLPYGCTVSCSKGNKTWDKDIERRKKNRSLPACPNATVCLRNSVCSEHSDTIHIVLLSKDTVLRSIRLKNIQSFWELSGFKVLHIVSGLAARQSDALVFEMKIQRFFKHQTSN